jgi:drug/metabolite transporter (DMT)-like permease
MYFLSKEERPGRRGDRWSERYLLSHLTLLGSVVAFSAFLTLLGRIGADRAGYVTVAVPVVGALSWCWACCFVWRGIFQCWV